MGDNPKKKMCWNCEGNVQLQEEICPYCHASLSPLVEEYHHSPPYKVSSSQSYIPPSPFSSLPEEGQGEKEQEQEEASSEGTSLVVTLTFLMGGSVFFLFGWMLFFFSSHGYLVLRWEEGYWIIFLLMGLPMLYFGLRNLQSVD